MNIKSIELLKNHPNVSHETFDQICAYISIILKWNKKINLIAKSTEDNIIERHVLDSLKIITFIENAKNISDLGSGGGFPGIIIAIQKPSIFINLIESDKKKCAFLRNIAFHLNLKNVKIVEERVENITSIKSDVITSRAFASIKNSLDLLKGINKNTTCLFIKGKKVLQEIQEAEKFWNFKYETFPKQENQLSYISKLYNIEIKS